METQDLLEVVKMLDKVIASERKETRTAFRELLTIAALSEEPTGIRGPLEQLVLQVNQLSLEVAALRLAINSQQPNFIPNYPTEHGKSIDPYRPTWVPGHWPAPYSIGDTLGDIDNARINYGSTNNTMESHDGEPC